MVKIVQIWAKVVEFYQDKFNYKDSLCEAINSAYSYGVAIAKVVWVKDRGVQRPKIVVIPPKDIFFDMSAKKIEEMEYLLYRYTLNKSELFGVKDGSELYEKCECYELYERNGFSDKGYKVTFVVNGVLRKKEYIEELPFAIGTFSPKKSFSFEGNIVGESVVSTVKELIDEINYENDKLMDAISFVILPRIATNSDLSSIEYMLSSAGAVFKLDSDNEFLHNIDKDKVEAVSVLNSLLNERKKCLKELVGIESFENAKIGSSATLSTILKASMSERSFKEISYFSATFLERLGYLYVKKIFDFTPNEVLENLKVVAKWEF